MKKISIKGDTVIWIILILLMLFSVVAMFSSTSTLAKEGETRIDILRSQIILIIIGLAIVYAIFKLGNRKLFRFFSKYMFVFCMALLALLLSHKSLGFIRAATINNTWRILAIGNFQIHIYEIIKVAMVMYLSWAVDTYKNGRFFLLDTLQKLNPQLKWLSTRMTKKIVYIYVPMIMVTACMIPGSATGAIFCFLIMLFTVLIGGLDIKEVIVPGLVILSAGFLFAVVNHASGYKIVGRQATWEKRIQGYDSDMETFKNARKRSKEYYDALDKFKQPLSAKIAVKEGGLFGKGPGKSTQRYKVSVMYEDFMYSFIIEEYGLILGGIPILILFLSLLARGSIVARHCKDHYSKVLVAGLVFLISGQAMIHIMVNACLIPMTGQTLPLISHGKFAFVVFCGAFGVILNISKDAQAAIEKETRMSEPIVDITEYEK